MVAYGALLASGRGKVLVEEELLAELFLWR
jgi:hypothetical protein